MGMAGTDPCLSSLKANDDRLCKFTYNGAMRQFYIYATPAFDPCKPASLIVDCHGLSETAEVHIGKESFTLSGQKFPNGYGSSWRMAVQKDNAIVVTPQGVNNSWSPATDVGFVNKAADMVEAVANVDKAHVYVTGISMGGQMTVATGCADANRWRGMAPVSMLQQGCTALAKPTPVISFHATTDQLTSYPADQTLMQSIATLNHCKMGPTASTEYGGPMSSTDPVCFVTPNGVGAPDAPDPLHIPLQACQASAPATKCVTWTQCDEGVEVVFCTVIASTQPLGGHILYNNDTSLDLSEVAWRFFKKFQK
jgi:poly(3-hydroxybutyrate) depolymerase